MSLHKVYVRAAGALDGKLGDNAQYTVTHKWRKISGCNLPFAPHHSHIFITSQFGEIFSFGLLSNEHGEAVFELDALEEIASNPFRISTTYAPNGMSKSGKDISQAFLTARAKCGYEYKFLSNNCQKFAREFMIALGSTHNKSYFHP